MLTKLILIERDEKTGFWKTGCIESGTSTIWDAKEKAVEAVLVLAGFIHESKFKEALRRVIQDSFLGGNRIMLGPLAFESLVRDAALNMLTYEKKPCECRSNPALQNIRCEHCGQKFCAKCAVEPDFYGGNSCPWCADQADYKGKTNG